MSNPLLSICLICYNQEEFILDALKGIATQEIDFDMELVVADDCSTDNTLILIKDFVNGSSIKNYRILERPANLGVQKNWHDALLSARGKYVALLEGDDYWNDRNKLQIQVNFLESNPDYVGTFHNTEERYEDDKTASWLYCNFKTAIDVDFETLCKKNVIPSCSLVFKIMTPIPLPEWYFSLRMADWPLNLLNSQYGNYRYIPNVMGVHRLHGKGVWGLKSYKQNSQNIADAYRIIRKGFINNHPYVDMLQNAENVFLDNLNKKPPSFFQKLKHRLSLLGKFKQK